MEYRGGAEFSKNGSDFWKTHIKTVGIWLIFDENVLSDGTGDGFFLEETDIHLNSGGFLKMAEYSDRIGGSLQAGPFSGVVEVVRLVGEVFLAEINVPQLLFSPDNFFEFLFPIQELRPVTGARHVPRKGVDLIFGLPTYITVSICHLELIFLIYFIILLKKEGG